MNKINDMFQLLLREKKFPMKIIQEQDSYVYKGRFAITQDRIIDFAVLISNTEGSSVAQIVFNNVAYLSEDSDRVKWFELINQLNMYYGLYYYFAIDVDNRVFARHVTEITNDVDSLFYILSKGGNIIRQVLTKIDEM